MNAKTFGDRLILAGVCLLALVWMAPLLWVLALSFKPNEFLQSHTDVLLSPPFTLKNYTNIFGTSSPVSFSSTPCGPVAA